jgi:hypothetical protein
MKTLLGFLMCFVFSLSQAYAISGGPFGGGGRINVFGTYAGILVPTQVLLDPGPPPVYAPPDNSLALFTLKIPTTGLATGTSAVFRNGIYYQGGTTQGGNSGGIQGFADPDNGTVTAIVSASFLLIISQNSSGTTAQQYEYDANGGFVNTKVVGNKRSFRTSSVRLKGSASLTYTNDDPDPNRSANGDSGGPITYTVIGFKQSTATS